MKAKLTTHMCSDKECGFQVTDHKFRDGMKCPKCNGHIVSFYPSEATKKNKGVDSND